MIRDLRKLLRKKLAGEHNNDIPDYATSEERRKGIEKAIIKLKSEGFDKAPANRIHNKAKEVTANKDKKYSYPGNSVSLFLSKNRDRFGVTYQENGIGAGWWVFDNVDSDEDADSPDADPRD